MVDGAGQPNAAHVILSPRLVRQLGAPSSTLRAFLERDDSAIVVYVGGEVDACNESTWRCLLGEAASAVAPGAGLIVDLTGLKFISCGALEILTKQFHWCRRYDIPMRLVTKQEVIRQIVRARIPTGALPIFPSATAALGHTEERPAQSTGDAMGTETSAERIRGAFRERSVPAELTIATRAPSRPESHQRPRRPGFRIASLSELIKRRWHTPRHVGYRTGRDAELSLSPSSPVTVLRPAGLLAPIGDNGN